MKIKEIVWQRRRDFTANYECESCGHVQVGQGYDDRNFHDNVVPKIKCSNCGKNRNDLIEELVGKPYQTKYPEGAQV